MRNNRDKKETILKLLLRMTYLRDFIIYLYDKKDVIFFLIECAQRTYSYTMNDKNDKFKLR